MVTDQTPFHKGPFPEGIGGDPKTPVQPSPSWIFVLQINRKSPRRRRNTQIRPEAEPAGVGADILPLEVNNAQKITDSGQKSGKKQSRVIPAPFLPGYNNKEEEP